MHATHLVPPRPVFRRFGVSDVRLNSPLPVSVYDGRGQLLLRRGYVIHNEEQMLELLERGIYTREELHQSETLSTDEDRIHSVYRQVGGATLTLKTLLTDFRSADPSGNLVDRVRDLALDILKWTEQDPDAAIAAAHMDFHNLYILAHQVHSAVLAALLAPRVEFDAASSVSLLCAALTRDLGMLELNELERQQEPLARHQRDALNQHPLRSRALLARAGVADPVWLDLVSHHHERADGSGYPLGLDASATHPLAGLLAVIDTYMAMIKPRAWRAALTPMKALKEVHGLYRGGHQARLAESLIRVLGMYPPGSFVRLQDGELAVVSRRSEDLRRPEIYSLYEANGMPRMTPLRRDPQDARYALKQAVPHSECPFSFLAISRIWTRC